MKKTLIKYILLLNFCFQLPALSEEILTISSFNRENKEIQNIKKDIRTSLYIVKSNRNSKLLPELKFYKYKVKKTDNIWKLMSISSLNIDTIASINNLFSIHNIKSGDIIYFSNIRGIIYQIKKDETLEDISKKFGIKSIFIKTINKITSLNKPVIFIPCGKLENKERSLILNAGFIKPLKNFIKTSGFGNRKNPFDKKTIKFHKGIDLLCSIGTPVYAARSGKVVFSGFKGAYGNLLIIEHNHKYSSYYGHLSHLLVNPGDYVKTGQIIAKSGNTGRTTGPHLHFEIRKKKLPVNPLYYLFKANKR